MKKEKVGLSTDEALAKVFKVSLNYFEESSNLYMKHLGVKADFLENQIKSKYQDEPLKFFKKAHKKWQMELEKLENDLMDVYRKIEEELAYKDDFYKQKTSN